MKLYEFYRVPSSTVEDYIKHIYLLSDGAGTTSEVPVGRVAEALKVVPGTATTMMKALSDAGLVRYAPRVGVQLTPSGHKLALHVLRRHRLIEQFLVEALEFDWTEVHEEAEQLEHVISELLLDRIDRFLGYPTEDPHGDPIPSASGKLREGSACSLADCRSGIMVEVERISDQDSSFLRFVAEVGLNPGARVDVLEQNTVAESVGIRLVETGRTHSMGRGAAAKIMVRVATATS